jgi:hypothetical protein
MGESWQTAGGRLTVPEDSFSTTELEYFSSSDSAYPPKRNLWTLIDRSKSARG